MHARGRYPKTCVYPWIRLAVPDRDPLGRPGGLTASPRDQSGLPAQLLPVKPPAAAPPAVAPPIRLAVPNAIRLGVPVSDPLGRPDRDPLPRSLTPTGPAPSWTT
jgi:hypothetical protein